jgi:glycosyltransferase involved in cell wall biosynthesis
MNVLVVNYEFPPIGGGAATASFAISKELAKRGHAVTVLTSAYANLRGWSTEDGIRVLRLPAWRKRPDRAGLIQMLAFVLMALARMRSIVRVARPDCCLVFFSLPCGPIATYAKWRFGVPYIVSLRGGDVPGLTHQMDNLHRILTAVRRIVLRQASAVVANSQGLADLSERADPVPVLVIPNGVDSDVFSPARDRRVGETIECVFVGRFQEQKNLFFLLRVFSRLDRNLSILHMVGDGPLRDRLTVLARELGCDENIVWHGWVDRSTLRDIYRRCDVLVNPSLYEGLPNVVLEAMACGLPVLASRVIGNDELVIDGRTGYLFDPENENELENLLRKILKDRSVLLEMAVYARQLAISQYTWGAVADAYLRLMRKELPNAKIH